MATITTQESGGGGALGGLGSLFSLGAMLIPGAQWMAPLGMGMNAINSIATGNPQGLIQMAAQGMGSGGSGNWVNPASGNLYSPGSAETSALWKPAMLSAMGEQKKWI